MIENLICVFLGTILLLSIEYLQHLLFIKIVFKLKCHQFNLEEFQSYFFIIHRSSKKQKSTKCVFFNFQTMYKEYLQSLVAKRANITLAPLKQTNAKNLIFKQDQFVGTFPTA